MSQIKIKNFGPIKSGFKDNDGFMDFKKVTVFIGNQGSGKSTVAKVFSTLAWLEKAINRGDVDKGKLSAAKFYEFFEYQRIENYFKDDTKIWYKGNRLSLNYEKKYHSPDSIINEKEDYIVPKIMYVPDGRNFLSINIDAYNTKGLPGNLLDFAVEFKKAQVNLNGKKLQLPFEDYAYEYDKSNDTSYIIGLDYKINFLEASSGLQSSVPLYIVSRDLSLSITEKEETLRNNLSANQSIRMNKEIVDVINKDTINAGEKHNGLEKIKARYYNKCFLNIVEEPEQNLFPKSQRQILNSLVEFNNMNEGNQLIITTHSPYFINFLSIAIQGEYLKSKIDASGKKSKELLERLYKIVPEKSLVSASDIVIYQLDETDGSIHKLPNYEGIPSDDNYLNNSLADGNELFGSLLEIEEDL